MLKTISALVAAAVLVAGAITIFQGDVKASVAQATKGDRADSIDCERQGWPYYQHGCIRDEARNAGRAKQVRLITTDRIDITLPNHTAWPEWSATMAELQVGLPKWVQK
jgi:hypothetical protein